MKTRRTYERNEKHRLDDHSKALVRALIYPVQFEENLDRGIDRVMRVVISANALSASQQEFSNAISAALKSSEKLADLIPQTHREAAIRDYLAKVQRALVQVPVAE